LTPKNFDSESLADAIATVLCTSLTLLMCHDETPLRIMNPRNYPWIFVTFTRLYF
jgi:hypothetical protein